MRLLNTFGEKVEEERTGGRTKAGKKGKNVQ